MSKYTPGEWHVGTMNDGLFVIDSPPHPAPFDAGPMEGGSTRVIVAVNSSDFDHATNAAHARLIAAVPALLAACRMRAEYLSRHIPALHDSYELSVLGDKADAAIVAAVAKVEGRTL